MTRIWFGGIAAAVLVCGPAAWGQEGELPAGHAECAFLGAQRERFLEAQRLAQSHPWSETTVRVAAQLGGPVGRAAASGGGREAGAAPGTIDQYIFDAINAAGVKPADKTNDFEFVRRVTLDLTGRVPTPLRVQAFIADVSPDKRTKLIEELLASPEWTDKWTMFFGDLFKNTAVIRSLNIVRYGKGRDAFYTWIKSSLASNKSYQQMATELITARGNNSYEQGELNWLISSAVNGGPRTGQDGFDQAAANVAETFLGMAHMNCILCHDGRRHLDTLSLWGKSATRFDGYQFSSFFSRTSLGRVRVDPSVGQPYYWNIQDNVDFKTDYALNTTTGNRPPRVPLGTTRVAKPVYPFSGASPQDGEDYRQVLAREVTNDVQFARAAINYIWKQFFGMGMVEPVDQFDPARLDPDNPPPDPWTLQPTNARLLNALAADFIASGYDVKALMREIVNSDAYQLSSRYNGEWKAEWESLFARHFARRLWAEEIHDAIVQTSGVPVVYPAGDLPKVGWAMQLTETSGTPGGAMTSFLDSFLRGNRDDQNRRQDGSNLQTLNLMNDTFVMSRTKAVGAGATASLLRRVLPLTDEQLLSTLYITVLSRYPSDEEKAIAKVRLTDGNRQAAAEDLLWSLYNKVDFLFNY